MHRIATRGSSVYVRFSMNNLSNLDIHPPHVVSSRKGKNLKLALKFAVKIIDPVLIPSGTA